MKTKILITGTAGFIGFHLVSILLNENYNIYGIDNINDYYDINLKYSRLKIHGINRDKIEERKLIKSESNLNYSFIKANLEDFDFIVNFMKEHNFDYVINLAAQAGVRYSIENPREYTKSNIEGFLSVLEGSKISNVKHLIYASTSSVYGLNSKMPLTEDQPTEHPISFYAATKKANEMMAHSYSHLFKLPTTGLRFFTVYGPWGRPDMALFLFTKAIDENNPINVFNHGKMIRDFTYVNDIVECIKRLIPKPPEINKNWDSKFPTTNFSSAPYRIFNIGNSNPVPLINYIYAIEKELNKKAECIYIEMQPGDVPETHADVTDLENYINFKPSTNINDGISFFVSWYKKWINSH